MLVNTNLKSSGGNVMKRNVLFFLALGLVFSGCSSAGKDSWLAREANPFLGKWKSDIPSAGMTLIFDYKTDGTFDYEMAGVPADQGGVGTGGYLVTGNTMATYLSFEGIAQYTFTVVNNDTINVTELEDGEPGNTAPFTRVSAYTGSRTMALSTPFLGKWDAYIPSAQTTLHFDYKTDGTFDYEMDGVPADQGGTGSGAYFVIGDVIVSYLDFEGAGGYTFEIKNDGSIDVTEINEIQNGAIVSGNTSNWIRP
jgi:hypothetical protein